MTRIRVGCNGYKGQLSGYWRELDALELSDDQSRAKSATQTRWRAAAPEDVRFVPRVPVEIALVDFQGPVAEAWWTRCVTVAQRVGADTIFLKTSADFRPTTVNRRALVDFFAPRRKPGLQVAWRAEGLWDGQPEDRDAVCAEAGLIPVVDPLGMDPDAVDEELPAGETVYWRLLGRHGGGTRFSESDLERLVERLQDRTSGYVIFGHGTMMNDARRLRALLTLGGGPDVGP